MSEQNNEVVHLTITLKELFSSRALKIPDYQRAYEWRTDHVVNLFNDTFNAYLKSPQYMMGTIILHRVNRGASDDIVDGQQRLITPKSGDFF